jgi:hypothetical protein
MIQTCATLVKGKETQTPKKGRRRRRQYEDVKYTRSNMK